MATKTVVLFGSQAVFLRDVLRLHRKLPPLGRVNRLTVDWRSGTGIAEFELITRKTDEEILEEIKKFSLGGDVTIRGTKHAEMERG